MSLPSPPVKDRSLVGAVGCCAVGAAVVLLAAGRPWAHAIISDLPGAPELSPTGRTVAPVAAGLGLAALAGAPAIVATRGLGRILVGLFLVVAGLGVVAGSVRVAADLPAALREPAAEAAGHTSPAVTGERATAWPLAAGIGGALIAGAGAVTAVRGRHWLSMSSRYERRAAAGAGQERSLWDAIGRGEDPTA